ncbi:MAG: hypothetical protein OEV40_02600, partial [Acidimicrobiia bacterium]|nr:hypothetical protein [Acidimicrobiia bacterium]
MHWAAANGADRVEILAERGAADLARRAGLLNDEPGPSIAVWRVDGAELSEAAPAPPAAPPAIPASHWALAGVMSEAGARPLDDHGQLVAEVAGLEVGRVVDDGDGPVIDVGVGQADRELAQLVHREPDPGVGLRRVIAAVADYRRPGSHHPLTRVGRERWLRSVILEEPGLVGAEALEPVVPLRARSGLRRSEPAAA